MWSGAKRVPHDKMRSDAKGRIYKCHYTIKFSYKPIVNHDVANAIFKVHVIMILL